MLGQLDSSDILEPIYPSSASTLTLYLCAYETTDFVISMFSVKLYLEASIMTDLNPASIASLQSSKLPWSTCKHTGILIFSSSISDFVKATGTLHPPIYCAALLLTPRITGTCSLLHSSRIYFVHSKLLILKCGTA